MRSFVKIIFSRNGEITLSFTNIGKSCPSHEFSSWQICLKSLFAKIKTLQNYSIYSSSLLPYPSPTLHPYPRFNHLVQSLYKDMFAVHKNGTIFFQRDYKIYPIRKFNGKKKLEATWQCHIPIHVITRYVIKRLQCTHIFLMHISFHVYRIR